MHQRASDRVTTASRQVRSRAGSVLRALSVEGLGTPAGRSRPEPALRGAVRRHPGSSSWDGLLVDAAIPVNTL